MQDKRLLEIKDFRQQLYSSVFYRKDACFDLLDALCSNTTATTPVMLSLNIHHRRTYNSITDVVSDNAPAKRGASRLLAAPRAAIILVQCVIKTHHSHQHLYHPIVFYAKHNLIFPAHYTQQ